MQSQAGRSSNIRRSRSGIKGERHMHHLRLSPFITPRGVHQSRSGTLVDFLLDEGIRDAWSGLLKRTKLVGKNACIEGWGQIHSAILKHSSLVLSKGSNWWVLLQWSPGTSGNARILERRSCCYKSDAGPSLGRLELLLRMRKITSSCMEATTALSCVGRAWLG